LRRFALDAIRDAALLDAKARHVALRELEAELDAGYGIYGGGGAKVRWATLVFDPEAAQWIANEEWHPHQKARWLDGQPGEGRYELQVPYSDPTELTMDILRHGDSVVVAADKPLADAVTARLASALARYAPSSKVATATASRKDPA
jgi:predicted DNA-binding transcriptional regulator YafY